MGYIATDLARIPATGFKWLVFLLEDRWNDLLRKELSENFEVLAAEVGPDALVIRGAEPQQFYDQVFNQYALHDRGFDRERFPFPFLLITDIPPTDFEGDLEEMQRAKMVLLPLAENYVRPGSITSILREVSRTLRTKESIDSLESLDRSKIQKHWGWITRYFDLKPNFLGFAIDLDEIINGLFIRAQKGAA